MISTTELTQLTQPLIERAIFQGVRSRAFRDRAACFVLERLGVEDVTSSYHESVLSDRIQRGIWIDRKVEAFFAEFPTGQCIEIDGGLSTRFHRLSDQSEWPRFQWLSINAPDVDDCIKCVFPSTDNSRSVASETPLFSWDKFANWQGAPESIVIAGENKPLSERQELDALIKGVDRAMKSGFTRIDVVLQHRFNFFQRLIDDRIIVFDDYELSSARQSLFSWLAPLNVFRGGHIGRSIKVTHFSVINP